MDPDFPFVDRLTKRDAGEVLNLSTRSYTSLLATYQTSGDRIVPIADVLRLATDHVTVNEVAERLGVPHRLARQKIDGMGIETKSVAGYDRHLLERLLSFLTA